MANYEIDKTVPIPRYNEKYPLGDMEIGDSFRVELPDAHRARAAAHFQGRKLHRKFVTRTVVEDGKKYIRVWRQA